MSDEPEEPKLIIDEDWKTQVQREKEELKSQESDSADATEPVAADSAETDPAETDASQDQLPPPPPASLSFLVTSLATQAMASLGQIAGEDGKPLPTNLDYARHFIDLIGLLEEKTKGNLDDDESKFLEDTLHQMRILFVSVSGQQSSKP